MRSARLFFLAVAFAPSLACATSIQLPVKPSDTYLPAPVAIRFVLNEAKFPDPDPDSAPRSLPTRNASGKAGSPQFHLQVSDSGITPVKGAEGLVQVEGGSNQVAICDSSGSDRSVVFGLNKETGWSELKGTKPCGDSVIIRGETSAYPFRPGKNLSRVLAAATQVSQGVITPLEFLSFSGKLIKETEAKDILSMVLTGKPSQISVGLIFSIKVEGGLVPIKGAFEISRTFGDNEQVRANPAPDTEVFAARTENLKSYCKIQSATVIDSRYCDLLRLRLEANSFELKSRNLEDLTGERVAKLSRMRTERGETLLMSFLAGACIAPEGVGASGFSSGVDHLKSTKSRIFDLVLSSAGDLAATDYLGRNAFHYAAYFGCPAEAEKMKLKGVPILPRDLNGNPFLLYAIKGRVPTLIEKGVSLLEAKDFSNAEQGTPTHQFSWRRHSPFIEPLHTDSIVNTVIRADDPVLFSKIMKLRKFISSKQMDQLIQQTLWRNNKAMFEVLQAAEVDFWRETGAGGRKHLVLDFLSRSSVNKNTIEPSFKKHLENEFGSLRSKQAEVCAAASDKDQCAQNWGQCESVKNELQRESCFTGQRKCSMVTNKDRRWACYANSPPADGASVCQGESPGTDSEAVCILVTERYKIKPARRSELLLRLFSSEEGFATYTSIVNRAAFSYKDTAEMKADFQSCIASPHAAKIYQQVHGATYCGMLISNNGAISEKDIYGELESCGRSGTWQKCSFPIFAGHRVRNNSNLNPNFKPSLKAATVRLCQAGEVIGCILELNDYGDKFSTEERAKKEKAVCEMQPNMSFCITHIYNLDNTDQNAAIRLRIKALPSREPSITSGLARLAQRKAFDLTLLDPKIAALESMCSSDFSACELAYLVHEKNGNTTGMARAVSQGQLQFIKSCESGVCEGARSWKHPSIQKTVKDSCKRGVMGACTQLSGEDLDESLPELNAEKLEKECDGLGQVERDRCYSKYLITVQQSPKASYVLAELCQKIEAGPSCLAPRKMLLRSLSTSKEKLQILKSNCELKKYAVACTLLGQFYIEKAPREAIKYFGVACRISSYQGLGCSNQIVSLVKKKRTKELKAALEEMCTVNYNHHCKRKDFYLMMAGGKAVPLDPVKASCKGGDAKDCAILRDYYREAGKQEEVTRLKAELCGANKSSISCAQDWEWQEEGMEYGF